MIGALYYLNHQIDGIIYISTYPCGQDSLVNNLAIRFLGWEDEEKCPSVLYLVCAGLAMGIVITLVGAGVAL